MARFIIVTNPLTPLKDCQAYNEPGSSIADFLTKHGVDMRGQVCMVDSQRIFADRFYEVVPNSSIVVVCPEVGATGIVLLLVSLAIAIAVYFLIEIPAAVTNDNGMGEADSAYTLRGQRNQSRLSAPIERHYGRTRTWPSYMSKPYTQFSGNDQYFCALFCVGLGKYNIEAIQVEDTPLASFSDVTYAIYEPGEQVTLFPTNVQTSEEVGGMELYGPNEPEYVGPSGPFMACAAGSRAYTIEVDVVCRQGLYELDSENTPTPTSVSVHVEGRLVDDSGSPLGSWTTLIAEEKTAATNKPQRYTLSAVVASGRYEVRVSRTSTKNDSFRVRHTIHWETLRAFCETDQDFGNTTLLAIRAKATNNLNDNSKTDFNVITTSILPVYDEGTGLWTMTETRSPVWAVLDVLRARYGRRLSSQVIDLPAFCALATELETEGITFDGSFDQRGTVWGTVQAILSLARATPIVPAGVISVVRDKPQTIPTLGFNGNNIARDTMSVKSKLVKYSDTDGLEVEYIDAVTWKRRTVLCLLGNDRGNTPRQVRLIGCTDRNRAYRWGMYQRSVELYQTDNITFETGLEGGTAVYGDLVAVKHELLPVDENFDVSTTGRLDFNAFTHATVTSIRLPVPPVFTPGETHRIALRTKLGPLRGPYVCTATTDPNVVDLAVLLDTTDIEVPASSEQPLFWFGVSGREYVLGRIVKIEPSGTHKINITVAPYDERIYAYDSAVAPVLDNDFTVPPSPSAPAVTGLSVDPVPDTPSEVNVSWAPAPGAEYYVVMSSLDGTTYSVETETVFSSYLMTVFPGDLWIKVYAVNKGAGVPATWSGSVGLATAPPVEVTGLAVTSAFTGNTLAVGWDADPMAIRFRVQYYLGAILIRTKTTANDNTTYDVISAIADAISAGTSISRAVGVAVRGENAMGDGDYCATTVFTNPQPAAPTSLTPGVLSGGFYPVSWTHGAEVDLLECRVYASATNGFTPGPGNLQATIASPGYTSSIASALRYWRVASVDKWGDEESMSAQAALY